VLGYAFFWIINNAARILALPFQEALALATWLLYQIQKGLYEIYDNLCFMLVLGGYLWPEPRDLNKPLVGQAFINTTFANLTGGGIVPPAGSYPAKMDRCSPAGATEHHLDYNSVPLELPGAEAMPDPFFGQFPEAFISPLYHYDPVMDRRYTCTAPLWGGLYLHSSRGPAD
jgi:hypothetical protein